MTRTLQTLLYSAALVGIGYGAITWVEASRPRPAAAPPRELAAVPVAVLPLELSTAAIRVHGFGSLLAARRARIAPEVGGRLTRVHPDWRPGILVAEGAELFAVDTSELELELAGSEARLEQARAALEAASLEQVQAQASLELTRERLLALEREERRWRGLLAEGHANESQVDSSWAARAAAAIALEDGTARRGKADADERGARARVRELEETAALARTRLDKAIAHAPFAGRVVGRAPAVGGTVAVGEPLVEIVDVSMLQLSVPVPEDELDGLRVGLPARVRVSSRPGLELWGRVAAVGVAADPATRSVEVEVDVPNDGDEAGGAPLVAGQFAEAEIEVRDLTDVLVVDRSHLVWRGGGAIAYVLEEGSAGALVARERALTLGRAAGEGFVVRQGLVAGELLITKPLSYLSDGAPVVRSEDAAR